MARTIGGNPEFDELSSRLSALLKRAKPVGAVVFRCTEPSYATEQDLLTGEGSRIYGGRWNAPRSFATVYSAITDVTALAEAKASHVYYGLDPTEILPRTIVAIDVQLSKTLDITDPIIRRALSVSATQMRTDDWRAMNRRHAESVTQAIGRAAYETGLEGLITPSCDGKKNLIWFPGNLVTPSHTLIRHVDRL